MVFKKINEKNTHTIFVKCSFNNTIGCLLDLNGNTIIKFSTGQLSNNSSKKGQTTLQNLIFILVKKTLSLNVNLIELKIKGFGPGRNYIAKELIKEGIKIKRIIDISPLIFNGCRLSK